MKTIYIQEEAIYDQIHNIIKQIYLFKQNQDNSIAQCQNHGLSIKLQQFLMMLIYFILLIMQVKSLKPPSHYDNFLDAQLSLTEQTIIRQNKGFDPFYNSKSEQLTKQSHNQFNLRKAIYNQLLMAEQSDYRNKKKEIFKRQNISALSKKHQNIRKQNYLQSPSRSSIKECQVQSNHLKVKQAKINRAQSPLLKRPLSSNSHQKIRSLSNQYSQKFWISRPQSSTRPQTSASKLSQMQVAQNTKKYFQFRKQNPLVIYPFESHLKIKRIDENPKILTSIITKKNKIMSKLQLYEFVGKIMHRKSK